MIAQARRIHPDLQFEVGDVEDPEIIMLLPGPFDVIFIVEHLVLSRRTVRDMFEALHGLCSRETRVIGGRSISSLGSTSYAWLYGLFCAPSNLNSNVLSPADIYALANLVGSGGDQGAIFAVVTAGVDSGLDPLINRFISYLFVHC